MSLPLLSVKRLCAADLDVLFKGRMVIVNNPQGTTVMSGTLDPATELYMVKLHDSDALPRGTP
jgi:hypothetical protein